MVYFQCQTSLQRRPAALPWPVGGTWSLALACGSWHFPHSDSFMSLQASLIIQRTSPLRSQSFPAKASAWTGPLTPVQTPRGSRDEVRS